jgi:hypothetical protein
MKMSIQKRVFSSFGRGAALATVAALAIATMQPSAAYAGGRHYHGGGGAAAMAAFAGVVGTIGAIAATQERRDYYYGGGPAYYDGGPVYYDAPAYGYYGDLAAPRNGPRYGRSDRGGF